MRFDIVTLFPETLHPILDSSILKRAQAAGLLEVHYHDLRMFGEGPHKTVDDTPYGGGAGMVLRVDVMDRCLQNVTAAVSHYDRRAIFLLCPQGYRFTQPVAENLASQYDQITLVCGHYEGFDERIRSLVDGEISLGDFVLTGGEIPALAIVDAVTRLLPGALTHGSAHEESHSMIDEAGNRLLEYPHYTRPAEYNGKTVPEILISGNHAAIAAWRLEQAKARTKKRTK